MSAQPSDIKGFSWLVVIGASWGGISALRTVLRQLSVPFSYTVVIVLHQDRNKKSQVSQIFTNSLSFEVIEAADKQPLEPGNVYISTPNYHMLVEQDGSLSHTIDSPVNFSRPSIDVLFQSAADAYGEKVVAVVLTGANRDGAEGAQRIKQKGGRVFVQDPKEAEAKNMPLATISGVDVDFIGSLNEIARELNKLVVDVSEN